MSVHIMSAAWKTDLPASEKLVLLALADCANDEGRCWPGLASLCLKTGRCKRSLQESLRVLDKTGHITRTENPGKGMNYEVHPVAQSAPVAKNAPVAQSAATGGKKCHRGVAKYAPKPSVNHKEPSDSSSDDDVSLRPEHVFEHYQKLAQQIGRPVPRDFTPGRRQLTKARIAQYSLDDFQTVFAKCRDSPFLRGDRGRTPLTFDWLMQKKNFQKTLEGNYDG